jgi:hypothetical protein
MAGTSARLARHIAHALWCILQGGASCIHTPLSASHGIQLHKAQRWVPTREGCTSIYPLFPLPLCDLYTHIAYLTGGNPGWIREGKVQVEETVFEGVESFGLGFQSLFTGAF